MTSRRAPRPVAALLQPALGRLAPASTLAAVQAVWAEAVGPELAANAEPVGEQAGVLRVRCSASVWAQELELIGPEVAARVNGALGRPAVKGLRARV